MLLKPLRFAKDGNSLSQRSEGNVNTDKKRAYIKSHERLEILAKKVGSRRFSYLGDLDSMEFSRDVMGFTCPDFFHIWLSNMAKKGHIARVERGVYCFPQNSTQLIPVEDASEPCVKGPLPLELELSVSDYQLFSWLVDRIELLNGKSARVGDRNRPSWVDENLWEDFIIQMLDWKILKQIEENAGERTFVIDIERCTNAFCVAKTKDVDQVQNLLHKKMYLQNRQEMLQDELSETEKQLEKLRERQTELEQKLVVTDEKLRRIGEFFDSSKVEKLLQDLQ
ncbi:MAG: hypothetical protein Q8P20_06025 [bacterium]|nr:hypothetical protein [bacterium]